jgi:hypothetical protein
MLLLRKHKYLENEFIYNLQISDCKYQYEVFEKVFTTIADKHKMNWKDIYKASVRNVDKYLLLCISSILIDKLLRIEFHLGISSRERLLGIRLNEIVRDYYKYI